MWSLLAEASPAYRQLITFKTLASIINYLKHVQNLAAVFRLVLLGMKTGGVSLTLDQHGSGPDSLACAS